MNQNDPNRSLSRQVFENDSGSMNRNDTGLKSKPNVEEWTVAINNELINQIHNNLIWNLEWKKRRINIKPAWRKTKVNMQMM